MSTLTIEQDCPIYNSFRVQQVAGLFDVPLATRSRVEFTIELPPLDEPWSIGAIVGPSGSGKSTVARELFGSALYEPGCWPHDRAVIDGFGDHSLKQITSTLTAVGFSSPPAWIKPFPVLSNGEQFRCDLARALLMAEGGGGKGEGKHKHSQANVAANHPPSTIPLPPLPCVFDEFTSVVDRTVAQIGSAAVAKAIRSGKLGARFVAVTCHYDVLPWLEPDWVLDMATGELMRGLLRRPPLLLEVVRCPQNWWSRFARHHYLSGSLARSATCYAALVRGEPVAFCATCGMYGQKGRKRVTRVVVLPDYQGVGIGMKLVEHVCQFERESGYRCNLTASHPAVIAHCKRSLHWRVVDVKSPCQSKSQQMAHGLHVKTSAGRCVVSFEYRGTEYQKAA
jgi:GNAT superfamily N-acetyltransferase